MANFYQQLLTIHIYVLDMGNLKAFVKFLVGKGLQDVYSLNLSNRVACQK